MNEYQQNQVVLRRWLFLADKLEREPSLLKIPLQNIERWKVSGRLGDTWALDLWKGMIEKAIHSEDGMEALLNFLKRDGERERQLKSCSPFPGVLTRNERDQFSCAWNL